MLAFKTGKRFSLIGFANGKEFYEKTLASILRGSNWLVAIGLLHAGFHEHWGSYRSTHPVFRDRYDTCVIVICHYIPSDRFFYRVLVSG